MFVVDATACLPSVQFRMPISILVYVCVRRYSLVALCTFQDAPINVRVCVRRCRLLALCAVQDDPINVHVCLLFVQFRMPL